MTFRSCIKSSLLRSSLLKGTALGGLGSLFLLYAGAFYSVGTLQIWGVLIFCSGMGLIAWGLIPYRNLKRLEINPYKIELDEEIRLFSVGKILFTIPLNAVQKISYFDEKGEYGIQFFFKRVPPKRVVVHQTALCNKSFWEKLSRKHQCDLFIPYFTARVYAHITTHLTQSEL